MLEFDWVAARSKCNLQVVFECLRLQVEDDVAKRNALRDPLKDGFEFQVRSIPEDPFAFTARITGGFTVTRVVKFRIEENSR